MYGKLIVKSNQLKTIVTKSIEAILKTSHKSGYIPIHIRLIKKTKTPTDNMGAPEFPGDANDGQNHFQPPPGHALPMHGIAHSEDEEIDSNDEASLPAGFQEPEPTPFDPNQPYAAEGYHPLDFEVRTVSDDSDEDDDDSMDSLGIPEPEETTVETEVETTAEREILNEIWNAPRPADSVDIALDNDKTEQVWIFFFFEYFQKTNGLFQIKSVMSKVSLQLAQVQPPEWALNVPESKWIEKLLEDVRNKGIVRPK